MIVLMKKLYQALHSSALTLMLVTSINLASTNDTLASELKTNSTYKQLVDTAKTSRGDIKLSAKALKRKKAKRFIRRIRKQVIKEASGVPVSEILDKSQDPVNGIDKTFLIFVAFPNLNPDLLVLSDTFKLNKKTDYNVWLTKQRMIEKDKTTDTVIVTPKDNKTFPYEVRYGIEYPPNSFASFIERNAKKNPIRRTFTVDGKSAKQFLKSL
jgi:hypothetical protein